MTSTRRPEGDHNRNRRSDEDEDREVRRGPGKKKAGAGRRSSQQPWWRELLPAAIAVGIGTAFLFPILLSSYFYFVTFFVAIGISIFGFVKGCLAASREGHWVAFDYLESLGPLRWIIAVGFFGLYLGGYLLLWTIAQVSCAISKPKAFLPWFGVQVYGFVLIVLGLITAAISDRMWQTIRPTRPVIAQPEPLRPTPQGPGQGKEPPKNVEAPVVTGDRDMDRALADLAGKDGNAQRLAAERLAALRPNLQRPVVAKKLAEALQAAPVYNHTPLIRALAVWATTEEVPVFVQFLSHQDVNTRNEVLKVIGKFRDERTVKSVVRCFTEFVTTYHGEQALKDLGPIAETEVLELLNQPNKSHWVPAIRVLKAIGTQRSLPTLQAASQGDISTQGPAKAAIAAIQARTRK